MKIQQAVLLGDQQTGLPLEFRPLGGRVCLGAFGLQFKNGPEPTAHLLVVDSHPVKQGQELPINVRLGDAKPRMTRRTIMRTEVVRVRSLAILGLLALHFARNLMTAVAALDEPGGISHRVRLVVADVKKCLHTIPGGAINDRLLLPRIPGVSVLDLTDVGAVVEDIVDRRAIEPRRRWTINSSFLVQLSHDPFERTILVGVHVEDAADVGRCFGIDFNDPAAIGSHVPIAIGRFSWEPAFLDATIDALTNIDGHLLGEEAGHVGQGAAHHPARGVILRGLRDRNERHAVFRFQPFQLDVIKEITRRSINLVEQQAIEHSGVLLSEANHLLERLALVAFAGGLGDLEQPDDSTVVLFSITLERIFLDFERETFPLLFAAADSSEGDVLLHGDHPPFKGNNHPMIERSCAKVNESCRSISVLGFDTLFICATALVGKATHLTSMKFATTTPAAVQPFEAWRRHHR